MLDRAVEVSYRHCPTKNRTGATDRERILIAAETIEKLYCDLGWPIEVMTQWVVADLVNTLERGPEIVFQDLRQGGITGVPAHYKTPSGLLVPATSKLRLELPPT